MAEGDGGGACRLIALNPKLREEARQVGPVLEAAKAPATRHEILEILIRHSPQYGVTARNPGEWASIFGAYLDALEGLPGYAVEEAFVRWNRGEGGDLRMVSFYPKSGQLHILAEKSKSELYVAAYRARKALEREDAKARPAVTPEERKAVGELMKGLRDELRSRAQTMHAPGVPSRSPHDVAAELRRRAAAPVEDGVGDVI